MVVCETTRFEWGSGSGFERRTTLVCCGKGEVERVFASPWAQLGGGARKAPWQGRVGNVGGTRVVMAATSPSEGPVPPKPRCPRSPEGVAKIFMDPFVVSSACHSNLSLCLPLYARNIRTPPLPVQWKVAVSCHYGAYPEPHGA